MLPMPGTLREVLGHLVVQQAGDHEALAAFQFDFGLHAARARGRES